MCWCFKNAYRKNTDVKKQNSQIYQWKKTYEINCNQLTFFCCVRVCCIVPLRSDVGLVELKGAAYLMSSPMVALVVRELVMLMCNQRLNERGAVSWDLDYLHSANATKIIYITIYA